MDDIHFHLDVNGKTVQKGTTEDLLFTFDNLIAYVSKFFTLKKGDMIFTGTPEGVGPVKIGDRLEAYIGQEKLLDFEIK
jgi:2-keto-4-pentenoate hydratase/2-oxohepta-3-ene-1,7-dioic acid hydratase in catechol pathway